MPNSFLNNAVLIESLKKGETKAYTYLVDNYHHKLCVYAFSLTNDHDDAEDIIQNVFIRTWKKREKLKTNFSIQSFLYKSVYNEFIDQYRKRKSVLPLEKKYIDELSVIVEDEENTIAPLISLIKEEIENLPPKCKHTFLLSKQDGLSNVEISEYLDISIKSVEAHITKAFSILRKASKSKIQSVLFLLFGNKKVIRN